MTPPNDQPLPDVAFHLDQLAEKTTAADLVRRKGQSKQLKVISEKKLMDWILALLRQHMAGKADAISDEEKQELVAKVQAELQKRMQIERELTAARAQREADQEKVQQALASSQRTTADYEQAIASYKAQLENLQKTIDDLQQDNFDLRDELSHKAAMLQTTIEEKDRDRENVRATLQQALRDQIKRSGALIDGVLGLDQTYYGGRHADENPVAESATTEEQFYHDFDVAAKVTGTLATDLQRLREIAQSSGGERPSDLLEGDLQLLAQLKSGSLAAVDVADPVAGLVEAVDGARAEAMALERDTAQATGMHQPTPVSALPDAEGKPAEVIAGATQVVRELGSLLARERQRLGALKSMADEADGARNAVESELEEMRKAYDGLVQSVSAKGVEAEIEVPESLQDVGISPAERTAAAQKVVAGLGAAQAKDDATVRALGQQLAQRVRDLGKAVAEERKAHGEPAEAVQVRVHDLDKILARLAHDPQAAPPAQVLEATHGAVDALTQELARRDAQLRAQQSDLQRLRGEQGSQQQKLATAEAALEAARNAQAQLASQLRDLGRAAFVDGGPLASGGDRTASYSIGAAKVHELDQALGEGGTDAAKLLTSARAVVDALRKDVGKHQEKAKAAQAALAKAEAETQELRDRIDELKKALHVESERAERLAGGDKELAAELVAAAQGDESLADAAADLSLASDGDDAERAAHLKVALSQLAKRKQQLEHELVEANKKFEDSLHATGIYRKKTDEESKKLAAEKAELEKRVAEQTAQLAALAKEKAELETDREEQVASAREAITRLTQQKDKHTHEATEAKAALEKATAELDALRTRATGAETASRALAESYAKLAQAAHDDQELAHAADKLDAALSEVPDEADIAMKPEAAMKVAEAGKALAARLALRKVALAEEAGEARQRTSELEKERAELAAQVEKTTAELAAAKSALAEQKADADENMLSAKEMISRLQEKQSRSEEGLKKAVTELENQRAALADAQARATAAEDASRKLAQALADLASDLPAEDEGRVDLAVALSECPAEGETDIPVAPDLAQRLADAGGRTAAAVAASRRQRDAAEVAAKQDAERLAAETQRLQGELQTTRRTLEERETEIKRAKAELGSTRNELKEQSTALAAKVQDLADARSKLAIAQTELDDVKARLAEREQALAAATAAAAALKGDASALPAARARAEAAEKAHAEVLRSLQSLAQWDDRDTAPIAAPAGGPLAKAAQRLQAHEHAPEAAQNFVQGVREQLQTVAAELAAARRTLAEQDDGMGRLQQDLSSAKAQAMAREHEAGEARTAAATASERADRAEAAARQLSAAVAAAVDGGDAVAALGTEDVDAAAKAGATALAALAERGRRDHAERERLAAELAQVQKERDRLRGELAQAGERQAELGRQAETVRASEQALAASAGDLGRELLTAAKAMAADSDPATAAKAAEALAAYDGLPADRRVAAAAALMPSLHGLLTDLKVDLAQTKSQAESDREAHERDAATLRKDLATQAADAKRQAEEAERGRAEAARLQAELAELRAAQGRLEAALKDSEASLLQANAELDEFRARGAESAGAIGGENQRLQDELSKVRAAQEEAEALAAEMREKVAALEAKMAKTREDLGRQVAERDARIAELDTQLDKTKGERADAHGLEAKNKALAAELAKAHATINEYKQQHGELSGATAQSGDLRKMLEEKKSEADKLRDRLREAEAALADRSGDLEEAIAKAKAKEAELRSLREKKEKDIEAERVQHAQTRDALNKAKSEVVGLQARLRRLTEH